MRDRRTAMDGDKNEPLKDEAAKRADWRGDETGRPPASGNHTLPASEDDDERLGGGEGNAVGHPATIPPPD